jgi:hypothetical protein
MAEVVLEDDEFVVRLSLLEKAETAQSDVRVPRSAVTSVEVVEHPVDAVGGWKLIGARLSGSFAIGTFVVEGRRVFAVVHRDTGRGVRIKLSRGSFYEMVIGCDDPEGVAASLAPA